MAENMNFDPGARGAATAGLRGAYDGSGSMGPTGPGLADMWGYDPGEGWNPYQAGQWTGTTYSPTDLAGRLLADGTTNVDGSFVQDYKNQEFWNAFRDAGLTNNVKFDRTTGQSTWTGSGTAEQAISDAFGADGLRYGSYVNDGGNRGYVGLIDKEGQMRGRRDQDFSQGFFEQYMPGLVVGGIGAIAGGIGAGMAGGGVTGAAVGGATAGGVTAGLTGGDVLKNAALGGLTGYLGSGVNVGQAVGAGEYADLVNKMARGGLQGAMTGGGSGALKGLGMAGLNHGLSSGLESIMGDTSMGGYGGLDDQMGSMGAVTDDYTGANPNYSADHDVNMGYAGGMGGGGSLSYEQPTAQKMSDFGLGASGSDSFDMPSAPSGDMTGSAGTSWDDEFKKFSGSPLARGGLRAFAALNPKYGQLMGAMGMMPQGKMSGMEAGLGALGTLYANHRQNKAIKSQQQQLKDLFSPNSAYSKEMHQQLERKDAAAGRRSQYGPREAQLAAMLTQQNAQMQPYMGQLDQMRSNSRNQLLRDLMIYGNRSGATEWLGNQMGQGLQSLQGMFQG